MAGRRLVKRLKAKPFVADTSAKTWYQRPGRSVVSKWYLVALLCATPELPVPHLMADGVYQELLGIHPPAKKRRREPEQ
eukprot:8618340-Lingulodinium_polyedra.AAC.1